MKNSILTLTISTLIAISAHTALAKTNSNAADPLKITKVRVVDVTNQYPEYRNDNFENAFWNAGAYLDQADVIIDKIINIGTKIWTVLDKGRATYNFNAQQANALPEGALRWNQLQHWRSPTSRVYSIRGSNIFGVEILKFDYRIILLAGGDVSGLGRYIGYATVQPMDVSVPFLNNLSAEVKAESVYNMGSSRSPVAGMIMSINVKNVSSIPLAPMQELGQTVTLDGNGNITSM